MHIKMYMPAWPPGNTPNGIVTYGDEITKILKGLGHTVDILSYASTSKTSDMINLSDFIGPENLYDKIIRRISNSLSVNHRIGGAVCKSISIDSNRQGNVVEFEESFGLSAALMRTRSVPVVIRLHGPWFLNGQFEDERGRSLDSLIRIRKERDAITLADYVTSPSEIVLNAVRKYYRIELPNAQVIPNPISKPEEDLIWNMGTARPYSILFVGRFDERKGGDLVIDAFNNVIKCFPEATLSFVGPDNGLKANRRDNINIDEYIRNIVDASHRHKIINHGMLSKTEIASLRKKHFACIVASRSEILPYAVLESMAAGAPTIATNVGGIPEIINNNVNGLLVNPDAHEIAKACIQLFANPETAHGLSRQARMDIAQKFSPLQIARQTLQAYERAIATHRHKV